MLCIATIVATGCRARLDPDPHIDRAYPEKLSEWRVFAATRPTLKPNRGVLIYEVNTPLFSDYADKLRTVWMPPGKPAKYNSEGLFDLPAGTILTKTFSFGSRMIETRVIVRQTGGWVTLTYMWNREQTDAALETAPLPVPVKWVDAKGVEHSAEYSIPNVNECSACHQNGAPLGIAARYLNRGDQLAEWVRAGYLDTAPAGAPRLAEWDDAAAGIDQRAEAYLEINCATCHRSGTKSGAIDLSKRAAIVARMQSTDTEKRMPSLGHTLVHREAVELMREWARLRPGV